MPTKPCKSGGKSGHKYGNKGKCYTGKDSKARADRQGRAIHMRQNSARRNSRRSR